MRRFYTIAAGPFRITFTRYPVRVWREIFGWRYGITTIYAPWAWTDWRASVWPKRGE